MRALDAAWGDRRLPDGNGGRALRTAMASQIMAAVGERDPEQLKRAALNATAGRSPTSEPGSAPANTLLHARSRGPTLPRPG